MILIHTFANQRDIDTIGTAGIIERIRDVVGENPVYLSIDIDVLDPAFAPATGTPEVKYTPRLATK